MDFVESHELVDLKDVHATFGKWLYMEDGDFEALDVVLCCTLDRDLEGDPIWLFLIAPSGDKKSEFLRTLSGYSKVYSIDTITPNTLVSGLVEKNGETGEMEPVAGLLQLLDGKILVVKDLTDILSKKSDVRSDIFGQLRAAYDGYYERGVGSLKDKIRVEATFGFIAGSTSVIDKYTKMLNQLGERFIKVRMRSDEKKATMRAFENQGKEVQMRKELSTVVGDFLSDIKIRYIEPTKEQTQKIISLARYIALLRTYVHGKYTKQGVIIDYDVPEPEMPTRIAKQLKKLAILLANLRGHVKIEDSEIQTLYRVARDTVGLKRRIIIDEMVKAGDVGIASDITNKTVLHLNSVKNKLEEMRALSVVEEWVPDKKGEGLFSPKESSTKKKRVYTFTERFKDIVRGLK